MFFDLANETNDFKHALKSKFCYSDVPNWGGGGGGGGGGVGGGGPNKMHQEENYKIINIS